MSEEKSTEEIIFEAARRVFKQKGKAGARMQEIADEAGINKSMLHYYFRNKDSLFREVYQREMTKFLPILMQVVETDAPLEEKVASVVDTYYQFFKKNRNLPQFIIMEMNANPERFKEFIKAQDINLDSALKAQLIEAAGKGNMDPVPVNQLIVSEVALVIFPFIASPMIQAIFDFDDEELEQFLEERKSFLVKFILNGMNYKK
ncbi:MAG TPA: TetR/AcrR family transcriptional regulator [Balneolaceae bacterium]|nr:TetR/AcrR family transcriptional regulator [Balneolaceae bacterium]